MAATTTTTLKTTPTSHHHCPKPTAKPKRRRCRETAISGDTTSSNPNPSASSTAAPFQSPSPSSSPSTFRIRFSPGSLSPVMDFVNGGFQSHHETTPSSSSFTKFNSVLTAGLLNPMSPPPAISEKTRSSPTLFEMMASEPEILPRTNIAHRNPNPNLNVTIQDKQAMAMQRIMDLLSSRSPNSLFNDGQSSDIKLTLSSRDGISVSMSVHRQILVAHSRFFAAKLSDRWAKQQKAAEAAPSPHIVEIADCEDVEVYIETLRLMYCKDLKKKLMKEDVPRVLGILKVSAAIGFDAGVLSCLEYLEAAPWAEEEEEKVASLLSELRLEGAGASDVLKRVSTEIANNDQTEDGNDNNNNEEILLKLLHVVLEGKDEKARRDMKGLVLKMLRENSSQNDLRKESLYSACDGCLTLLKQHFFKAAESDLSDVGQISRQADNLHWILDILIDRQIAEDFMKTWASQTELSSSHSKVPAVHRFEISRVTARLFVGIGKGQILASKDVRGMLLKTWLVPFYDDFGWMRRASKGLDRHLIEDGLSNTILTLPLMWQQEILLAWFDRFLNSGEDCPNIQRGFEVWWRRAFWRRTGERETSRSLRIANGTVENS